MQIQLGHIVQLPAELASKWMRRSGSMANEAFGLARDIVIITEGALPCITGLTLRSGRDIYAADVASDPFAHPWDEVVRSPRSLQRHPNGGVDVSCRGRPAA